MNNLLINWLHNDPKTQQLISFNHHDIVTGSLFTAHVAHLFEQLNASPIKRWLLAAETSDLFAAGMCAALLAGKQVVLPANIQGGTLTELNHAFDGVISDQPLSEVKQFILLKKELGLANKSWPETSQIGELVLFTSGSSGEPKAIAKSIEQLDAEVSILEQTFASRLPQCSVISTVSHQHIYGLLFKILWPLAASRPFLSDLVEYPETLSYYIALMPNLCLISSPAQLSRLPEALEFEQQQLAPSLIFSSGGPLLYDASQHIHTCYGQFPIEVFGSTETGGIAYRRQMEPNRTWLPFSCVEICENDEDGALMLKSPYLPASNEWMKCDDKIELAEDGRFTLLHRLDRIVKVEEKRLSLAQMEGLLCTHPFVKEAAVIQLTEPRIMLGAAICLSEEGLEQLDDAGKLSVNNHLKKHLLSQFERVTLPRRWRYPDTLPLNAQGKRVQTDLLAVFNDD
ncbi:AMP-binding protein [Shewanella japonica]|uniref:AMP-dependent synthetase/ligase n=1 Tax=Shewanella japonica TaxID=93973 RepID=A0ABN4Y879_9GAMM|nr:AMP-binding protein [Shewanella japonica]ARD20676.1 AMP-dependent synthetase/ligase [Shewanella japonica]